MLQHDRPRFERYAVRDAEIALLAFTGLRQDTLDQWGIDVLYKPTLAALAAESSDVTSYLSFPRRCAKRASEAPV